MQDRAKLEAMIDYCQSAQCRTRFILEYFGEQVEPDWRCQLRRVRCDRRVVERRIHERATAAGYSLGVTGFGACGAMEQWSPQPKR